MTGFASLEREPREVDAEERVEPQHARVVGVRGARRVAAAYRLHVAPEGDDRRARREDEGRAPDAPAKVDPRRQHLLERDAPRHVERRGALHAVGGYVVQRPSPCKRLVAPPIRLRRRRAHADAVGDIDRRGDGGGARAVIAKSLARVVRRPGGAEGREGEGRAVGRLRQAQRPPRQRSPATHSRRGVDALHGDPAPTCGTHSPARDGVARYGRHRLPASQGAP